MAAQCRQVWGMMKAGRALVSIFIAALLLVGCNRLGHRGTTRPEVLEQVAASRQAFRGLLGRATLTLEHRADKLIIPVDIEVTADLVLEARGEIEHFLLPFRGEVRLVCDNASTLLFTDVGTYDLAMDPEAQPAVRAFLLSLIGGGDWLVWWLAENACLLSAQPQCHGLELRLEADETLPSMSRWEMTEPERGVTFRGEVDEYEPGTGLPRAIRGVILPNEITVYLKYTEISRSPGPSR